MNRTTTSPVCMESTRSKKRSFPSRLSHLEAHTPQHRGDISGDLSATRPDLYFTIKALCAFRATYSRDESHVDLARQCGKSLDTTRAVFRLV
jgi:hypothetical protein